MFDDVVAAVLAAPTWAQIGMAFFALTFVVMVVEPRLLHRRVAARFAALAAASGATVTPGSDQFTESFEVDRAGRRFTVRRELRETTRGSSYRGPRGHLLICATPLSSSRWQGHGVDIAEGGALPFFGSRPFVTGDVVFDKRFTAWQDGEPVRSGWLDAPTRDAVTAFFDGAPLSGSLWVQGGMLEYVAGAPKGMDATALNKALHAQSAVAHAFERTAGWRGPVAQGLEGAAPSQASTLGTPRRTRKDSP